MASQNNEKDLLQANTEGIIEESHTVETTNLSKHSACPYCNDRFSSKDKLKNRLKSVHVAGKTSELEYNKKDLQENTNDTVEESHTVEITNLSDHSACPDYSDKLSSKHKLKNHLKTVHVAGERSELESNKKDLLQENTNDIIEESHTVEITNLSEHSACPDCSDEFSSKHELKNHLKTVHVDGKTSGLESNENRDSHQENTNDIIEESHTLETTTLSEHYACPNCSDEFSSKHGIIIRTILFGH